MVRFGRIDANEPYPIAASNHQRVAVHNTLD
jgi:hypothetical protein